MPVHGQTPGRSRVTLAGSSFLPSPPCPAASSWRWEMALGKFHSVIHLSRINRAPTLEDSALSKRHLESTWGLRCPWETWKINQKSGDVRDAALTPKCHGIRVSDFALLSQSLICEVTVVLRALKGAKILLPQTFNLNYTQIFFRLYYKKGIIIYDWCQVLTH